MFWRAVHSLSPVSILDTNWCLIRYDNSTVTELHAYHYIVKGILLWCLGQKLCVETKQSLWVYEDSLIKLTWKYHMLYICKVYVFQQPFIHPWTGASDSYLPLRMEFVTIIYLFFYSVFFISRSNAGRLANGLGHHCFRRFIHRFSEAFHKSSYPSQCETAFTEWKHPLQMYSNQRESQILYFGKPCNS